MLETGPLVLKYHHKSIICPVNSLGYPFIFDSENMRAAQPGLVPGICRPFGISKKALLCKVGTPHVDSANCMES